MQHLFDGQLEFESEDNLGIFLQTINIKEAILILEIGINQAAKKGSYSIKEAVMLDGCLTKLKSVSNDNPTEEPISDQTISEQDV